MGAIIAVLNKSGENAADKAVTMLRTLTLRNAEAFGIASPSTVKIEKTVNALQNRNAIKSNIVVGHAFAKVLNNDKPQPIKLENAALTFEGRIYSPIRETSDVEAVAKKLRLNHEKAESIFRTIEGDFTFAIAENKKLITGRDPMGVRPLYYGENANFVALASERKALWKIGIEKTSSFPPGSIAVVDEKGFKFKLVKTVIYPKPKQISLQTAAEELQKLLQFSVKERVFGLKEVAIAFSGGLDSSLTAFLGKKFEVNVHLIHVSLVNQLETEHAIMVAEDLKLPLHFCIFKEEDVGKIVPKVVGLIEEPDPVKTSIGIPLYWAAKKAAEMDFKVMLAGQGADEFFGGYRRYVDDYLLKGSEKVRKRMLEDITRIHEANLERDFKICNFHGVELRLPFVTYKMAKFALGLPVSLKIERKQNTLRKLVLRRVAENLGLPEHVVKKAKKAMQYTTGVNKALKALAKRQGTSVKEYLNKAFHETLQEMIERE